MSRWFEGEGLSQERLDQLYRFGWAPGGYTIRCVDCTPPGFVPALDLGFGSKRSIRCYECACKRADQEVKSQSILT